MTIFDCIMIIFVQWSHPIIMAVNKICLYRYITWKSMQIIRFLKDFYLKNKSEEDKINRCIIVKL